VAAAATTALVAAAVLGVAGGAPAGATGSAPAPGAEAGTPTGTAAAAGAPRRLLVLSDSTLAGIPANGTLDDLHAALPGWEVTFDARAYRNTAQAVDIATGHDPSTFDAVVVGLGANDAWSPTNFSAQMARLLEVLSPVPDVYWLTLRESPRFQASFAPVNSVIRLRASATPGVELADWNRFGAEHPEAFYDDGLHLSPAGAAEAARFVATLVGRENPYLDPEAPPPDASPPGAAVAGNGRSRPTPLDGGDGVPPAPRPGERGVAGSAATASAPARTARATWPVIATIGAITVAGAAAIALSRRLSSR